VISAEFGLRTLSAVLYRKLHRRTRLLVWADVSEQTERGRGALRALIRRLVCQHVDLFLVNGESGARYLRSLGVEEGVIRTVPSTVDLEHFSKVPVTRFGPQAHRILYVGQIVERKGLREFLHALVCWARHHAERHVEWVLAGAGPFLAKLAATAVPTNLHIHFLGPVPYRDLPALYNDAGILALPSLADAWGMTVNEGLAAGLPVLGSLYAQAAEELIADGVNGWTFRPDRQEEVISAIDRALHTSTQRLNKMRGQARQTACRLTPQRVASMMIFGDAAEPAECTEQAEPVLLRSTSTAAP
jgi:glycosyltransferase involved in cell wall biosynthesis